MRGMIWLVLIAAVAPSRLAAAEAIPGECQITVAGRTYRDGPCRISRETDGSLQVGGGSRGEAFATVDIDAGSDTGQARWNGPDAGDHAHHRLGSVLRAGACWVNDTTRIYAWRAGTRPQAGASTSPPLVLAGGGGRLDVPLVLGGDPEMDACSGTGRVVGLDPKGDGFLSVRSGPGGRPYSEVDRLFNGDAVAICDTRGPWLGVVYGAKSQDCNTSTPWPTRKPYAGPCKSGWIHRTYVRVTAG